MRCLSNKLVMHAAFTREKASTNVHCAQAQFSSPMAIVYLVFAWHLWARYASKCSCRVCNFLAYAHAVARVFLYIPTRNVYTQCRSLGPTVSVT